MLAVWCDFDGVYADIVDFTVIFYEEGVGQGKLLHLGIPRDCENGFAVGGYRDRGNRFVVDYRGVGHGLVFVFGRAPLGWGEWLGRGEVGCGLSD